MANPSTNPSANTGIDIDMVSDFVCPWCWLGLRQFRAAKVGGELVHRPFFLDPLLPPEGRPYRDYMRAKFGEGEAKWRAMREHLEAEGPRYGIDFRFDTITHRPHTRDAHRLQRWATGQDRGEVCADALFKAYFQSGRDIGETGVLAEVASDAGLDGELVRELLGSDRDSAHVDEEAQFFRRLGISGVPTFIYNGEHVLQGAQDPEAHQALARQIRQAGKQSRKGG